MEYQDFPSKTFCLTVPRNFVGKSFSVSLPSGAEEVWIREGGLSRFSVKNYLSHSAEKFRGWGESFSVSFISGIDKVWIRGGEAVSRFSVQNFLSHSAEKSSKGTLKSFTKFGYGKFFCIRGLCHDFRVSVEIFLSHIAEKFRR